MRTLSKVVAGALLAGCTFALAETKLTGSGATFPQPLYQKMVAEYQKAHPEVKIDYTGGGSGQGIKDIIAKTVAFAGSDAPMKKDEIEKAGGPDAVIQVPSCAGGIVPAYNLPGVKAELKFTGDLLAKIYLGTVSKWNDKEIAALNEGVELPDTAITPAYRSDGSGTTSVFTNYLAGQSEAFKTTVGAGKDVKFPVGQGGKGNPGVTQIVQSTPGAIGYIELAYADQNRVPYGSVKNRSGKFVKCSRESIAAAGNNAVDKMKGTILAANIWDQEGDESYPIASFTYLIVYKEMSTNIGNEDDAKALATFLWWATHEGQSYTKDLDYAPLAKGVQEKVEGALKTLTFKGQAACPVAR
jgi:phosphate transport system substrate-binding protein